MDGLSAVAVPLTVIMTWFLYGGRPVTPVTSVAIMATKKKSGPEAMQFIVKALQKNKDVAYADVHAKAEQRGLTVYPIMYGRAKALLGLVPVAKRGEGKAKKAAAKRAAAAGGGGPSRRGPGRPRKGGSAADSIATVISALQEGGRERDRYRKAIDQIRAIVEGVA